MIQFADLPIGLSSGQGGNAVASSALDEFEVQTSKAYRLRGVFTGPLWEPSLTESPALPETPDFQPESSAEDGSYVKGFLVTLALETAMALGCCGIWQLWHLLR
jgi:hypothetical protein